MGHLDKDELVRRVAEASEEVEVGVRYRHFRTGGEYVVIDLVLMEATEEVGVVYEGEDGLRWVRELQNFCEEVEVEGQKVRRFEEVG